MKTYFISKIYFHSGLNEFDVFIFIQMGLVRQNMSNIASILPTIWCNDSALSGT